MNQLESSMTAAAANMAARLEQRLRNHRGELGALHEVDFRELLQQFLPQRFRVASGEVITSTGEHMTTTPPRLRPCP